MVPDVFRSVYDCLATVVTYREATVFKGKTNTRYHSSMKDSFVTLECTSFLHLAPKGYVVDYVLRESEGTLHSDDFSL